MKYFIYCRKSQEAEDRQVMSLQSQQDEINRLIANNPELEIAGVYTEAFSAKQPGRPQFNDMMSRIERGEAQGIIAWHPDRLARNSMDGGRIIFALDQGQLKDMRFCSYSFENDPQGKFMLNIVFGYSKYQVDTLSVNVKRGLKTKLKNGWKPNLAPIGYKNCKESKTIIPDGKHFEAIKGMFNLMLSGGHTPSTIHRVICNEWGYTTPQRKRTGGTKPSLSTVYKLLSNPFYAGFIRWKGQLYTGSHIPLVTKSQFKQVQKLLRNTQPIKSYKKSFPYIGVMRCGACGLSITAETKTKPSGKQYTYYHCTRKHRNPKCQQPAINSVDLELQIEIFLNEICIPEPQYEWIKKAILNSDSDMAEATKKVKENSKAQAARLQKQLSNLTDLRTRELLTDDEFISKREKLMLELADTEEKAQNQVQGTQGLEPISILSLMSNRAKNWHSVLDDKGKRKLITLVGYNPKLIDKKAILEAKKPLLEVSKIGDFGRLCGNIKKARTTDDIKISKALKKLASSPEVIEFSQEAKHFIQSYFPDELAALELPSDNYKYPIM